MKTIHNLFNNLIAFLLGLTSGCTVIFGTILVGVIIAIGEILEKEEKEEKEPKRVSYYNRPKRRQFYSSMMQDQNDEDIEEENENENNN